MAVGFTFLGDNGGLTKLSAQLGAHLKTFYLKMFYYSKIAEKLVDFRARVTGAASSDELMS